jgi:hypothetical protein
MVFHPQEYPPDDSPHCESCGSEVTIDYDVEQDEDGNISRSVEVYCTNEDCPESPDFLGLCQGGCEGVATYEGYCEGGCEPEGGWPE